MERFARIDLDLSDFEKECNPYMIALVKVVIIITA